MRRVMDYLASDDKLEVLSEDGHNRFRGYAAVFGVPSEDMGGFRVVIEPEAFANTLRSRRDVRMFLNHDDNIVLGSTRAGTLELAPDERGLLSLADLPDNEWGRPVIDGVNRGDIHTMSVGFKTIRDEWTDDHRTLRKLEMRLFEVSPITSWAAFPQTSASMFSLAELAEHIEADQDAVDLAIEKLSLGAALSRDEADLLSRAVLELYAQWTQAYINDLPDSSFAYIAPGGEKDEEGKTTPRSLRYLPHHDAVGALDMPHLRNGLSRVAQTDLPADAQAEARRHMERHMAAMNQSASVVHLHHLALTELRQRALEPPTGAR